MTKKKLTAALSVLIILVLGLWVPSPYLIERPGPTVNTLGSIDISGEVSPVVAVSGVETFEGSGELRLLTVSVVGNPENRLGWLTLFPTLFDPTQTVVRLDTVFGEGVGVDERDELNALMMQNSQKNAIAAALRELDKEFESNVIVNSVLPNAPAAGLLQDGDLFLTVDGDPVASNEALREYISALDVGSTVVFEVLRDNKTIDIEVETGGSDGSNRSVIGVLLETEYEFPVEVDILLEGIGGPSAGLVFALAIYELLTESDFTDGLTVSGTGTVDDEGNVGAIGGVTQKLWGAKRAGSELFLLPETNCKDLPEKLPTNMSIVPIKTVGEAIAAISDFDRKSLVSNFVACDELLARSYG